MSSCPFASKYKGCTFLAYDESFPIDEGRAVAGVDAPQSSPNSVI